MATYAGHNYPRAQRSRAIQWFTHRITGTFLVFLLITHFWVQHYDRTTASISHDVVTAEQAERGVLPRYSEDAARAVAAARARDARARTPDASERVVPAQGAAPSATAPTRPAQDDGGALGHPPAERTVEPYDVLMLRLADPVYAVLWKGFNLLFLAFALHHGFYGLNNVMTDYIRNDIMRVTAQALSYTVALVLFIIGSYSVIVAGLNP